MTDQELKEAVTTSLRLSTKAATSLSKGIDRNIKTARLDLIRMGVSSVLVGLDGEPTGELIAEAIITYCQMKMGPNDEKEAYEESYNYQADCIRKSGENYKALEAQALAELVAP